VSFVRVAGTSRDGFVLPEQTRFRHASDWSDDQEPREIEKNRRRHLSFSLEPSL
jgi:hypothetical protein